MYVADEGHCFLFAKMIERRLASKHLESKYSYGPDVNLFCVWLSWCDLWGRVVECSTTGLPLGFTTDRPPKVANLANSLDTLIFTWLNTIFSGLISRCKIYFLCIKLTASQICPTFCTVSSSSSFCLLLIYLYKDPSSRYSSKRYIYSSSWKYPYSFVIFGWSKVYCSFNSLMNWGMIDLIVSFWIFFNASIQPVFLCVTW